jgi:ATP synthase protein I
MSNEFGSSDAEMRARLAKLGQDLGTRGAHQPPDAGPMKGPDNIGSAMSLGFRVMSEFVAAVGVGALIGWQADKWFGTSPLLLILFLLLGTAAGFWSVYKLATKPTGLPSTRR